MLDLDPDLMNPDPKRFKKYIFMKQNKFVVQLHCPHGVKGRPPSRHCQDRSARELEASQVIPGTDYKLLGYLVLGTGSVRTGTVPYFTLFGSESYCYL
jgi:hypothetical protein